MFQVQTRVNHIETKKKKNIFLILLGTVLSVFLAGKNTKLWRSEFLLNQYSIALLYSQKYIGWYKMAD